MGKPYCTCTGRSGFTYDPMTDLWVCSRCRLLSQMVYRKMNVLTSDRERDKTMNDNMTATFITDLQTFLAEWAENNLAASNGKAAPAAAPAAKGRPAKKAAAKPAPAPETEDDEDDDDSSDAQAARRAELNAMTLTGLRKVLVAAGFDKEEVKDADKATMVESILDDEAQNATDNDDEDEEDDEEVEEETEDDEESDTYTRADLEGKGLRELQKIAREEYGLTRADYAGMDVDSLIGYLTGEEDEEAEEEADEDAEEEDGYTEADLMDLSLVDLKGVAKEYGIKLRVGMKQTAIIAAILKAQDAA